MGNRPDEIANTILSYLREHPDAGDTLEGIDQWWIQARKREVPVEVIHAALRSLVHQSILTERRTRDGETIYRLAKKPSRR
jgi:hypothetical protein